MKRKWFRRSLALLLSLAFSAAAIEAGVRLAGKDAPIVWAPDPVLGWHHVPGAQMVATDEGYGHSTINSLGFRDHERTWSKMPGTFRVAVIGDSMTAGMQVDLDETFSSRLEQKMNSSARVVEVLNLGIAGFGSLQELLLLRRDALRFQPDLVIWAVFLDNDIADCHPDLRSSQPGLPYAKVTDEGLKIDYSSAESSFADYHRQPKHFLRQHSVAFRWLSDRWRKAAAVRSGSPTTGSGVPKRYGLYQNPLDAKWNDAWTIFNAIAGEFAAELRSRRIPLVILAVPAGQVVRPENWTHCLQENPGMKSKNWDLDQPTRMLSEVCARHSIPWIETADAFRQASAEPPLFFGHVGHLTSAGHALTADLIHRFLVDHDMIAANPNLQRE